MSQMYAQRNSLRNRTVLRVSMFCEVILIRAMIDVDKHLNRIYMALEASYTTAGQSLGNMSKISMQIHDYTDCRRYQLDLEAETTAMP